LLPLQASAQAVPLAAVTAAAASSAIRRMLRPFVIFGSSPVAGRSAGISFQCVTRY
jgi:hypothetical protein